MHAPPYTEDIDARLGLSALFHLRAFDGSLGEYIETLYAQWPAVSVIGSFCSTLAHPPTPCFRA